MKRRRMAGAEKVRRRDRPDAAGAPVDVRAEIEALVARHGLEAGAADALDTLVRELKSDAEYLQKKWGTGATNRMADSLAALELEEVRSARRMADIGSGGGFPGLVLAVGLPDAHVALLEERGQRCDFLERTAKAMGLDNVEVVRGRAESWEAGQGTRDLVTCRGVSGAHVVLDWAVPLLAPGGAAVIWQSPRNAERYAEEMTRVAEANSVHLASIHSTGATNRFAKHHYVYVKNGDGDGA